MTRMLTLGLSAVLLALPREAIDFLTVSRRCSLAIVYPA